MDMTAIVERANAMYRYLRLMPCTCAYNVPYAGGAVERKLVEECGRCRTTREWEEAGASKEILDLANLMRARIERGGDHSDRVTLAICESLMGKDHAKG
jgi:hypothetical protein